MSRTNTQICVSFGRDETELLDMLDRGRKEEHFKNIKVTNLVYEMLMELSKKSRPQQKPELLLEQLIKDRYNTIK